MKKYGIILIVILGAFFRFYAVNWDSFGAFHPDERNISWAVTRIHFFDQLNPKFFAYGGFPIYLYRAIGEGVVFVTKDSTWLFDWGHIAVIGRYVSATLSTISIFLIYLVGATYFSQATGLTSAALLAFSPWAIQQAHFDTTETMLVFYLLLLLYFSKKYLRIGSIGLLVVLGFVWGLAMASKTTAILFGVIPLVTFGKKIHKTFVVALVAAVIFFCFSPYTLLDFQHFRESMTYESGVALGKFSVPYTLQFFNTPPYLYQLSTMLWQAGPLVIVGLVGLIFLLVYDLRSKISFLIFPLIYFGWLGSWYAKFARYNVPFLPFVTIAAAWICTIVIKRFRIAGLAFITMLLSFTILWGIMNFTVYLRPQTKAEATRWIASHIPENTHIYTEHWNDGLPLDLPNIPSYRRDLLTVYDEPDNETKAHYLAQKLATGEYVLFSSRRMWATFPRLSKRYPITSTFYTALFAEKLGYHEVATFTSYPQFAGLVIPDDTSEESLQVFDHPTVRIFQNVDHLTEEALVTRLMSLVGN